MAKELTIPDIINELTSLEIYFEQGRDRARKTRERLEGMTKTKPVDKRIEELKAKTRNRINSRILKHQ